MTRFIKTFVCHTMTLSAIVLVAASANAQSFRQQFGGTPVTQPSPTQQSSLIGLWSARITEKGITAGIGLLIKSDGTFEMAMRGNNGTKMDYKGQWIVKDRRLTLLDGKQIVIAGSVQVLGDRSFTLNDGVEVIQFTRVDQKPQQQVVQQQPRANPVGMQLANTTWSGSENLANFGKLTFQFHANGQVTMIDAAGASQGTWRLEGSRVTLLFANGNVAYVGNINGGSIAGSAANRQRTTWQFSVQRQ